MKTMRVCGMRMNAVEASFYAAGVLLCCVGLCCLVVGLGTDTVEPADRDLLARAPDLGPYVYVRSSKLLRERREALLTWAFVCGGLGALAVGSVSWLCQPAPARPSRSR
jgi:hypothetical protein